MKCATTQLLALVCVVSGGCTRQDSQGLKNDSAPSIHVREITADERARIDMDIKKGEAVDAQFPGSPIPWGAPTVKISQVVVPGILKLASGKRVQLDGVRCNEQAVSYLSRVLQGSTVSVVVVPSDESRSSEPIPAEVWSVDDTLQLKGLTTTPSYSNIVETSITSGWCHVEATQTCKRNERYAALARAFQHTPKIP